MTPIKLSELLRLNTSALVSDAELSSANREYFVQEARKSLAEDIIHRIVHDCVEALPSYMGHSSKLLTVDVFVLTPTQLHQLMAQARDDGMRDAFRFRPMEIPK